jgi:hypothetical protein
MRSIEENDPTSGRFYAFVSMHCWVSGFQTCPTAQDIVTSLPWLPHPSARTTGVLRIKAKIEVVINFISNLLFDLRKDKSINKLNNAQVVAFPQQDKP